MNEIAQTRTAERFSKSIKECGLTNKQVSEITGINYYYIGKAASKDEWHKAPKWVMRYLRDWANTGESILNAKWEKLAKGYNCKPAPNVHLIANGRRATDKEVEKFINKHEPLKPIEKDESWELIDEAEPGPEKPPPITKAESEKPLPEEKIDPAELAKIETLTQNTVRDLKMLIEIRDKLNQTINDLKTIITKWE